MQKICIVNTSLANGGAERFGANLSLMLCDLGYDVHILITKTNVEYNYSGKLFKLENATQSNPNNLDKLIKLKVYFKSHNFDTIIDNRARSFFLKEFILYKFVFKASKILSVVHNYNIENYIPKSKILAKNLYNDKCHLVAVSKKIKDTIKGKYNFSNVISIYNSIDIDNLNSKGNETLLNFGNYILYFGRLEKVKNLSLSINSYNASILKERGVKLMILGSGKDEDFLKELIMNLNIEDSVTFIGHNPNPFPYVKNALFTVLSSKFEGFPMSIIESLACGTPVVSVDCDSGPSEVIKSGVNGLLVENFNQNALSNAMSSLIENEVLYNTCKSNAKKSVRHLDVEEIKKQWFNLIQR